MCALSSRYLGAAGAVLALPVSAVVGQGDRRGNRPIRVKAIGPHRHRIVNLESSSKVRFDTFLLGVPPLGA
ncbi:hypothetical protein QBC47DRAFT_387198 [Echria macrotheca]|uniref:Uncharacterized protein n=1 Tax=Echria macrotheca TaxID=438768 RepID=A0AAJ0F4W1_9PEZI|nr:hypothetical protein QBC47DRAFT_387198 [Echria macrotheca]